MYKVVYSAAYSIIIIWSIIIHLLGSLHHDINSAAKIWTATTEELGEKKRSLVILFQRIERASFDLKNRYDLDLDFIDIRKQEHDKVT